MNDWLDAEGHADRAFEMYERGHLDEAEHELRKALALNPDQPEWQFNLGLTLEAAGRETEALQCYEKTIELMPDELEPLLACATLANRLQRHEAALQRAEQALRLEPTSESGFIQKMEAHFRRGEHEEVETTHYLAQEAMDDPSASCLSIMAESLIEQRQYDRAGWCLREAMRIDPGLPRLRAQLAAVLAAQGGTQRAVQLYLRDLRDDPGNIDTLLDFGELLMDLGRGPEAAEKFRRVLELEPANVDAHSKLGLVAMDAQRYGQASTEFELVLKLDPKYPGIRIDLGEAALRRGRLGEASAWFERQLARLRKSKTEREAFVADDYDRFAELLLEAGMSKEAAHVVRVARQTDGETADRMRLLALACYDAGDVRGGVRASKAALRLEPTCVRSMYNLALADFDRGRFDAAAERVRRAMVLEPREESLRRLGLQVRLAWLRQRFMRMLGFGRRR